MGYYSLFRPLTKEEKVEWNNKFGHIDVNEGYDSRSYVNEEENVQNQNQNQTTQQMQPSQTVQNNTVPQNTQHQGQHPQIQQNVQQPQVIQPQNILNDQTWKTYQQNPSYDSLKAFYSKLTQVMQKMDTMFGNQSQQPQMNAQPMQNANDVQQNTQLQESRRNTRRHPFFRLNEEEEKKDKEKETTKVTTKDFGGKSEIKYDNAMNRDDGGTEHDFEWDKKMHDSIFGTAEDIFQDTKEVKYDDVYGGPMDKPTERDMGIDVTKADPFKPEKPSFTSLSNPRELSKTVFTSGTVKIKDAPSVAKEERVSGIGRDYDSSEKSKNVDDKKEINDGSDGISESFKSSFDSVLDESFISDKLKKVVLQEFLNSFDGDFDITVFGQWIQEHYPNIARNPKAFDDISSEIQNNLDTDGVAEFNEDDVIDSESEDDGMDIEGSEELTLEDIVEEYFEQYEGDEYDEDDATEWLEDNYEVDDETKEDFLDMVSDEFIEDDINESLNDDFFSFETV